MSKSISPPVIKCFYFVKICKNWAQWTLLKLRNCFHIEIFTQILNFAFCTSLQCVLWLMEMFLKLMDNILAENYQYFFLPSFFFLQFILYIDWQKCKGVEVQHCLFSIHLCWIVLWLNANLTRPPCLTGRVGLRITLWLLSLAGHFP